MVLRTHLGAFFSPSLLIIDHSIHSPLFTLYSPLTQAKDRHQPIEAFVESRSELHSPFLLSPQISYLTDQSFYNLIGAPRLDASISITGACSAADGRESSITQIWIRDWEGNESKMQAADGADFRTAWYGTTCPKLSGWITSKIWLTIQ